MSLPLKGLLTSKPYIKDGAKRIRTADPLNAIEVLYQLSYNPLSVLYYG